MCQYGLCNLDMHTHVSDDMLGDFVWALNTNSVCVVWVDHGSPSLTMNMLLCNVQK